jgi:very-short-patch-repair endonuclease
MDTISATLRSANVVLSELHLLSQTVETLRDLEQQAADVLEVTDSAGLQDDETMDAITTRLEQLAAAWEADAQLAAEAKLLAALDVVVSGPATNVAPIQAGLAYVGAVQAAGLPECAVKWLFGPDARLARRALQAKVEGMSDPLTRYEAQAALVVARTALDVAGWCASSPEAQSTSAPEPHPPMQQSVSVDEADLSILRLRMERALEHDRALHPWTIYRRSRANALTQGLGDIVSLVESERILPSLAADTYEAVFFRTLAETVLRAERALDTFDSGVHTEVQQRYARLDKQVLELTKQVIAHELTHVLPPRGLDGPRVADMTDTALIRHEIGKTRRHIAIRELFRRAGPAIQAIKPCFLMGPQAVAQYLPPGRFEFDLVVMDEASQLGPEDALGAIARGGQVLIVGDPMQLGPTRFFDAQGADDDDLDEDFDDEDRELEEGTDPTGDAVGPTQQRQAAAPVLGATVLERSESILLAAAARFPVRMLRWHYRSKHPKLIAFSNREFYNDGLVVFPTPGTNEKEDGVFLHRVEGLYGGRRNMPEAQAVVAAVQLHARRFPKRSLLVATLNAEQADLIDGLVEAAEKDDPELAAFRAHHAETREPFTIKNLENVQGDERDSIMVSVTFGPNVAGKLNQNFGPINKAGGERRLNVLFTRAKHRLEVFCSFDASMLRVSESTSPRGLRVLRDYLRYAAGEVWWAAGTETGREPDSDFEVAVASALRSRGYEVRPQIGVAGYFLDLAVVDPDAPDRFLLAIECDGATYHSAKTARDRDRLRQTQLESLGWHMHRIWSTDWFKHPVGEADRVVRHIEQLRTVNRPLA